MGEAVFVRLALASDEDAIVDLGRMNAEETKQADVFSERRAREVIDEYLAKANPTIFVADHRREVVGFLIAYTGLYEHRDGFFTSQRVLYVRPDHRGSRAAILLMKELVRWSTELGAAEIVGGNDNGFQSERTARFLEHFGFEKVGYAMTKRLEA